MSLIKKFPKILALLFLIIITPASYSGVEINSNSTNFICKFGDNNTKPHIVIHCEKCDYGSNNPDTDSIYSIITYIFSNYIYATNKTYIISSMSSYNNYLYPSRAPPLSS